MIVLPAFGVIAFFNKEKLLAKENRKNAAIFAVVALATVLFFAPQMLNQFGATSTWYEDRGSERFDLLEAHASSWIAENAALGIPSSQDGTFILRLMNLFYSPLFLLVLLAAIPISARYAEKKKDLQLASLLFVGLANKINTAINITPKRADTRFPMRYTSFS